MLLAAPKCTDAMTAEISTAFVNLLAEQHAGEALRILHELGYLEKIVPAMRHARGLLQFNQYHKFTVDEHCLRAVKKAEEFAEHKDALGEAYRGIRDKRILHLALLLHDLGKGFEEDHSEVGRRLAEDTAERLKLSDRDTEDLAFLVHQHLVMAHLAFRRDTSDEFLIKKFADEVGSVDRLRMLFVLTCADLAAVGPGVLNNWKIDVLTNLCNRSEQYLRSEHKDQGDVELATHREAILGSLWPNERDDPWFQKQARALPTAYLASHSASEAAQTLQRLHTLTPSTAGAWAEYHKETNTVEFIAGVDSGLGRGTFSGMAGALSSGRMQILAANTEILADGLIMLRYNTQDVDHPDGPSPERLEQICQAMIDSIDSDEAPQFRQIWGSQQAEASVKLSQLPNDVRIDNDSSEQCTILEVFTFDRAALLYSLARKLHDLNLIIRHAKIGTYLDQVVDVFYVTDREDEKIQDESKLTHIREELLAIINTR